MSASEVDHRVPKAKGGTDDMDNLQSIHPECHRLKSLKDSGCTPRPRIGIDGWPIQRELSDEAKERRFPSNLSRSLIPVTMVCGPAGSGKSTYLRTHALPNDLIIDLDQIAQKLSGLPEHQTSSKWVGPSLDERNRQLRDLATDTLHERAWFVIAASDPVERQRWADTLGAQVVVLATPLDECMRRINADPSRAGHTQRMIAAATLWWEMNGQAIPADG